MHPWPIKEPPVWIQVVIMDLIKKCISVDVEALFGGFNFIWTEDTNEEGSILLLNMWPKPFLTEDDLSGEEDLRVPGKYIFDFRALNRVFAEIDSVEMHSTTCDPLLMPHAHIEICGHRPEGRFILVVGTEYLSVDTPFAVLTEDDEVVPFAEYTGKYGSGDDEIEDPSEGWEADNDDEEDEENENNLIASFQPDRYFEWELPVE